MFPKQKLVAHAFRPGLRSASLATAFLANIASAQWTYEGCGPVTDAAFRYETLIQRGGPVDAELEEPLKMAFDMDAQGNVDIFYVERTGNAKLYRGATRTASIIGHFTVGGATGVSEEGLLGVALDPHFKQNRRVYYFFMPPRPNSAYRLSRFIMGGTALDMKSEKIMLEFPHDIGGCCHNGGGMAFDDYGDLWLSVGGNGSNQGGPIDENNISYSEEDGSANTADYRGGVLRIHPDDSPRGYSIPAGNFGDYFAAKAQAAGNTAYAAQFRDTALVKPEIYIKGSRNPFTMTVDPARRWVMTGDVGPDNGAQMEEHNLYKAPAFSGWPYFAGKNLAYQGKKDAITPRNDSKWNTGIRNLPPAAPALRSYGTATAITGPIYRYDGDSRSTVKLPPHFQRRWFIADFEQNWIHAVTLDEAGGRILKDEPIFKNHTWTNPIDLQQGPDGALYVINYAGYFSATGQTSIVRIAYEGDCRPSLPKLEHGAETGIVMASAQRAPGRACRVFLGPDRSFGLPPGTRGFVLFDLGGNRVWGGSAQAGAPDRAMAPPDLAPGVYQLVPSAP